MTLKFTALIERVEEMGLWAFCMGAFPLSDWYEFLLLIHLNLLIEVVHTVQ